MSAHRQTGKLNFLGAEKRAPIIAPGVHPGQAPHESALVYADTYGQLFGLPEPRTGLTLKRESRNAAGGPMTRFQQTVGNVPVIGGEIVVNLDVNHNLLSMGGRVSSAAQTLPLNPTVSASSARQTAMAAVAKWHGVGESALIATLPELSILDPQLIGPSKTPARLVWRLEIKPVEHLPIRELVLVDAQHGQIALHFNQVPDAKNRQTYSANGTSSLPGTLACSESSGDTCTNGLIPEADLAHRHAGSTYNFYLNYHGRDSIDNTGMTITSTVNWSATNACPNAFWNGSQVTYCAGMAADDIVAHEITHGLTEYTSGLLYYYQSGAINESLSDVWGEFVDQGNGTGNDAPAVAWHMGEDSPMGAIRNMANPPAFGDPDRMLSLNYYTGIFDNGGVHTNSGVNNKAAYLMVAGDTFNNRTVTALGLTKTAKIYYEAQTQLLTSGSDYLDLYNALYQACQNLVGTAGITTSDCTEVRDATDAVEMNLEPVAGFNPEAALCSAAGQAPIDQVFYGFETNTAGWTFANAGGVTLWSRILGFAKSGQYSLYAPNESTISDKRAQISVAVPSGTSYLHFSHAFDFEGAGPYYDGGVIEYCTTACTVNTNWQDASPLFDAGAAGGKIYGGTVAAGFGNPLAGRSAFVGTSNGYVSTRLNLATLANQTVQFRWRAGTDSMVASPIGWLIDNVRVFSNCTNTPTVSAGADQRVNPGTAGVTLTGTGADSDGTISSYLWVQTLGPTITLAGANTTTASFTAPSSGATLEFRFTATDNAGAQMSDTVIVTVNTAPTVNAGADRTASPAATVALNGIATDIDGSVASYAWTQIAGTAVTLTGANSANASFPAPTFPGILTFRLTVTDNEGTSNLDTVNVTVLSFTSGGGDGGGGGGGGGCALGSASRVDPTLWMLLLASIGVVLRRRGA